MGERIALFRHHKRNKVELMPYLVLFMGKGCMSNLAALRSLSNGLQTLFVLNIPPHTKPIAWPCRAAHRGRRRGEHCKPRPPCVG